MLDFVVLVSTDSAKADATPPSLICEHGSTMKNTKCMLALVVLSATGVAAAQDIQATVDGSRVYFSDVQPLMVNNRVMVPVRGVFEKMNADVAWNQGSQTVTAKRGNDIIKLVIDSHQAMINDRRIDLDTPARVVRGRTMVPLRFLSESLGAKVDWIAWSRTVEIKTQDANNPINEGQMVRNAPGTVMPVKFNERLTSNRSKAGETFTATLDTDGADHYQGLPRGTVFEGHVDVARPKTGNTPGVLGLDYDRVRLPDGRSFPISGATIGLDSKSVSEVDGRIVAKPSASNNNLKYVGYGAGAGALLGIVTKGNVLTNALIGGALGFLFGEIKKDPSKARDVNLAVGTKSGVRLTQELAYRMPVIQN